MLDPGGWMLGGTHFVRNGRDAPPIAFNRPFGKIIRFQTSVIGIRAATWYRAGWATVADVNRNQLTNWVIPINRSSIFFSAIAPVYLTFKPVPWAVNLRVFIYDYTREIPPDAEGLFSSPGLGK